MVQGHNKVGGLDWGLSYSLLPGVEAVKSGLIKGAPYGLDWFKGLDWLVVVADCLLSHLCQLNGLIVALNMDCTLSLEVLVLELYFLFQ